MAKYKYMVQIFKRERIVRHKYMGQVIIVNYLLSTTVFYWTFAFKIWYLKQASPKAANIHNRWWRERSERNLRFHSKRTKRPRRGRTQASYANIPYVRPLRGRSYHHFWTAGFAAFGSSTSGYGYSPPSATLVREDNRLKMCLLSTCESSVFYNSVYIKTSIAVCDSLSIKSQIKTGYIHTKTYCG